MESPEQSKVDRQTAALHEKEDGDGSTKAAFSKQTIAQHFARRAGSSSDSESSDGVNALETYDSETSLNAVVERTSPKT